MIEKISFTVGQQTLAGLIYKNDVMQKPTVLFLHGAGGATKERIHYIAEYLLQSNIASFTFDFSGHGESTGTLEGNTLQQRILEAGAATQFMASQFSLVGSSMGGHIALSILPHYDISSLLLFAPGIYGDAASDVPFGPEFSAVIRQSDSWIDSSTFQNLAWFVGKILVVIGENDEVIPKHLITKLDTTATNIYYKKILIIPDTPHAIHKWLVEHQDDKDEVFENIIKIIS